MKTILTILVFTGCLFAQYKPNDSTLVSTTFTREFNKKILGQYLFSKDTGKVKAALYSISHSNDTTFIQDVIKLDYSLYGKEICFALGQLGPNSLSEGFLLNKLNSNFISPQLLQALGKCGGQSSFDYLSQRYNESDKNYDGISIALFYFNSRGLLNKEKALPVLLKELRNKDFKSNRQADAAFTIYRANLTDGLKEILTDEIKQRIRNYSADEGYVNKLYYMLGSIRLIKFFPDDKELFYSLQSIDDHIIKIEAAKALAFFNYTDKNDLFSYLRFFNDNNPNVTRTAATSLRDIKLNNELKSILKAWLEEKIVKQEIPGYSNGELLISYITLFNPDFKFVLEKFGSYTNPYFLYKAAEIIKTEESLNYLTDQFFKADSRHNKDKLLILLSLSNFQDAFRNDIRLKQAFIESINSDFPPLVSVAAEGIDSIFIIEHRDTLSALVISRANKYLNNADFTETVFSIHKLAEKIDTNLSNQLLNTFKKSRLFSVREFASNKLKNEDNVIKDGAIFVSLWNEAFKYSSAEIETSKGKIKIKFFPEYAPVSVGNFCNLASQGYFNNNVFHRVVPAFVIQGGDTTETGWSGPGYEIISEFSDIAYKKGMVGMASAGKDTEGSQWFITTGYYPHLNGKYTIFAEVIEGMENVYLIDQDDEVISIKLFP